MKAWTKRQTAVKGRLPAMMISVVVHLVLLVVAGTFVAVTVVQRQEARFEGRQVSRPRMQLQRLQVPQRARQERQAPEMSQRVTAQSVSTRSVDFQMPEIAGLGGGISVDMSGAGFAGSLGFATPQLNLFGLRSQGEKVVFLLGAHGATAADEIGGIPAYEIIKNELVQMIGRLPPTTLFNVIVFETQDNQAFSPELVCASSDQVQKLKEWLAPLNTHKADIGLKTLAWPGVRVEFERMAPIPNTQKGWIAGLSYAIQHGVDSVYWLGATDGIEWIHRDLYEDARRGRPIEPISGQPEGVREYDFTTYPGGRERWDRLVKEAKRLLEEDNARRRAAGQPERVGIGDARMLVEAYLPGQPAPSRAMTDAVRFYTAQDVVEYVEAMQKKYAVTDRRQIGTGLRPRRFSLNVIHFVPQDGPARPLPRLSDAPRRLNGDYIQIRGLEAIRSAATAGQ